MSVQDSKAKFGLIVVGDEILSGRRQDQHLSKVIQILKDRGIQLTWAEFVADDPTRLVQTYQRTFSQGDIVFSCGGIGATPDDHTRLAAAQALGVPLVLHPEAEALITQRSLQLAAEGKGSVDMMTPENQSRLQMGFFPKGAAIIPNPYNQIPGFSIQEHYFLPGFPVMAWPMIEWVLEQNYRQHYYSHQDVEHSFFVYHLPESRIIPAMQYVEAHFDKVKAFSLPTVATNSQRARIELGVKGPEPMVTLAYDYLYQAVKKLGAELDDGGRRQ